MELKSEPKPAKIRKNPEKRHAEIDAKMCYFQKGPKNPKNCPRCVFELKTAKRLSLGGMVYAAGAPQTGPHLHACDKRREGASRKKEETRKKERVQGYKGTRGI